MYEIIAKTEMKRDEFIDRLSRGADSLEIQLLPKKSEDPELLLPYADKVRTIHSTLDYASNRSVDFEDMDYWASANLDDAFRLAQFFSQGKRMIGIVIHLHTGLKYLEDHNMFEPAFLRLEATLKKYPNTYILIENGMLANHDTFSPGFNSKQFSDTVRKVREMSSVPDRIFSLIDTTHAKSNSIIEAQIFRKALWTDIYESWFRDASDTLREIHFANCIDLGLDKGEHGVDFNTEDQASREFFRLSMGMVDTYAPESLMCIEVSEKDYKHAENFSHIRGMIQRYKIKAA